MAGTAWRAAERPSAAQDGLGNQSAVGDGYARPARNIGGLSVGAAVDLENDYRSGGSVYPASSNRSFIGFQAVDCRAFAGSGVGQLGATGIAGGQPAGRPLH